MAALAAAGAFGGGLVTADHLLAETESSDGVDPETIRIMVAAADVIYPSAVGEHREFVKTYVRGRGADRPRLREGRVETTTELDEVARDWYDGPFTDLPAKERDELLREAGAETADPDPAGTFAERVRFYIVNDLLYALYTSPKGGTLVGIDNPVGHPGGVGTVLSTDNRRASVENRSQEQ